MRLVAAAVATALAAAGVSAQPVSTAPLSRSELLLEIDAVGTSRATADRIFSLIQLNATGSTAAEARAALAALRQRVIAAARSAGAAADDIRTVHPRGPFGFTGNEAVEMTVAMAGQPEVRRESETLELRITDISDFERIRSAIEAAGAQSVTDPLHALTDAAAARRAARDDGIRRARADAEAYARLLGMRVVRVVRVSERTTGESASIEFMEAMVRRFQMEGSPEPELETKVQVSVDFALAPQ